MDKLKSLGSFIGLLDAQGQISRTNIVLAVFVGKYLFSFGFNDMIMALSAMAMYLGKKFAEGRFAPNKKKNT